MVNTFVPVPSMRESCEMLDTARLGKQRSEIKIILGALTGVRFKKWKGEDGIILPEKRGYMNHSVSRMWKGHEMQLARFGLINCVVWAERLGHDLKDGPGADTLSDMESWLVHLAEPDVNTDMPEWWGREDVHRSHREVLLFKDEDFYRQYGWSEEPKYEYVWPV